METKNTQQRLHKGCRGHSPRVHLGLQKEEEEEKREEEERRGERERRR